MADSNFPIQVTYPGQTAVVQDSEPRTGLVPRKIVYPFVRSVFYRDQLRQINRFVARAEQVSAPSLEVRQRQKRVQLAPGVFNQFGRGR